MSDVNIVTGTLWDLTLSALICVLPLLLPEVFSLWVALSVIPLLTCRVAISSLEPAPCG
ncbi:MAG: hypothetical protein P8R54_07365 [Myxococcota bacterium]|nr:hypothetical protein [Myxococcota bacterium]